MKVGYDGKRAVANLTGLGNYSRFVLESVARAAEGDELLVYAPERRENRRLAPLLALKNIRFLYAGLHGLRGALWRTFGITRRLRSDGVDLYHGLSNELPWNIRRAGIPSVVTVHDLIFLRVPDNYSLVDRMLYNRKYRRACRMADRIVAVSECTKRDIVELYGIPAEKIEVIYQGCDASFAEQWSTERLDDLRRRLQLPERYIVQVGTIEKRKNLELTIRALARIDKEIHLVAVGRDHHGYKPRMLALAQQLGVADRIKWVEGLPFADLPGIYQASLLSLYPSRYEGFGIPVLEALTSGVGVIAATGSCLEEAGGDAAMYVDPDDVDALVGCIRRYLSDPLERERRRQLGRRHASRFRNDQVASRLLSLYRSLLQK